MLSKNEKRELKELTTFESKMDTTAIGKMLEGIYSKKEIDAMGSLLLDNINLLSDALNWVNKSMDGEYWFENTSHNTTVGGACYSWRGYSDVSKVKVRKIKPVQELINTVTKDFEEKLSCKIDIRIIIFKDYDYNIRAYHTKKIGMAISGKRMPTLDEIASKKSKAASWKSRLRSELTEITTTLAALEKIAPDDE